MLEERNTLTISRRRGHVWLETVMPSEPISQKESAADRPTVDTSLQLQLVRD